MDKISAMLTDQRMKKKLQATSAQMQKQHGPTKAAKILDNIARQAA